VQKAREFTEWERLSVQAEEHGLGPLLYLHLRAAGVHLPPTTKRELQGLYLRHRHANQVRMRVLREILVAYDTAGIQALVLKGAALSHLIYPEPGLRPMGDIDILVKKSEARRAQNLLAELGFNAPLPPDERLPEKHMAVATLRTEGLLVSVEVHHDLFGARYPVSIEDVASLPFALDGLSAYTLGHADMLWHLCQHMILRASVFNPTRLIWVADIVTYAEHFVEEIDWEQIKAQYPLVLNVLSLLHFMTPLPERLLNHAPLKIGRAPRGIGQDFMGWPRSSLAHQRKKGYRHLLLDTFLPSEWWLRMHYGLDSVCPIWWYRWVRHPLEILGWVKQLLLERLRGHTR
jgi:hypothetical protein